MAIFRTFVEDGVAAEGNTKHRRAASRSDLFWVTTFTGILIGAIALISRVFGERFLFASLGPSALMHACSPNAKEASFYNTVLGHFIGIGAGVVVILLGLNGHPATEPRAVYGSVLAVCLTVFFQLICKAFHAPAASTTLIIALGAVPPTIISLVHLAAGVVMLAVLGEIGIRLRRKQLARKENSMGARDVSSA